MIPQRFRSLFNTIYAEPYKINCFLELYKKDHLQHISMLIMQHVKHKYLKLQNKHVYPIRILRRQNIFSKNVDLMSES